MAERTGQAKHRLPKEWQERVAARQAYVAEVNKEVDASWDATTQPFAVADLETTGINAETDEVIEFAVLRVEPSGTVAGHFACLVRPSKPIPEVITRLTGITQAEVERSGVSLADAMKAFIEFVGVQPVFFHNARFDEGFLRRAASVTKTKFANAVHDTLPMARRAWPSLGTYKLALLSEYLSCAAPSHRALPDATAALAVLLAARDITKRDRAS